MIFFPFFEFDTELSITLSPNVSKLLLKRLCPVWDRVLDNLQGNRGRVCTKNGNNRGSGLKVFSFEFNLPKSFHTIVCLANLVRWMIGVSLNQALPGSFWILGGQLRPLEGLSQQIFTNGKF